MLTDSDTDPPNRRAFTHVIDYAVCLAASTIWSWPYLRVLNVTLRDPYDGEAQAWVLAWVRHALLTNPGSIFQANILAPARDVLAYTEPLIGYGLLSVPFALSGLSLAGSLNAVCLLMLALVPFGISRLAMGLGVPRVPALLGGFAAALSPLSAANLGFVYFSAWGGIALVLLGADHFLKTRTIGSGAVAGLAVSLVAWFSLQLFAFTVAALMVFVVIRFTFDANVRKAPACLVRAVPGGLLAGVLLIPLAVPLFTVRAREGFRRDEAETRKYSATLAAWITSTPYQPAHRPLKSTTSEAALYPGSACLLLGLAAFALARRNAPHMAAAGAGAGLALFGVLASLGWNGPVYPALVTLVPPLFGGIRSAFRFAYVAETGFGLLAASGAWALWERLRGARNPSRARGVLALCAALAIFVDGYQRFPFEHRPPLGPSSVDQFLGKIEPGGPILFLPLTNRPAETRLMLRSSFWGFRPIVNGNISYIPARHRQLAEVLGANEIDPSVLDTLESWPTGLVVCPDAALPLGQRGALLRFLSAGLDSGRLEGPEVAREAGEPVYLFGVTRTRRQAGLPALGTGGRPEFLRMVGGLPPPPGPENPDLPASIDEPADGQEVRGDLRLRGWAQTEGGPAAVIDVRLQGMRRTPILEKRGPRPDVGTALPQLGDPSRAGYELVLRRLASDSGRVFVDVTFQAVDGRTRTLRTSIVWAR